MPARARAANPDLVPSAKTLGIYDNSVSVVRADASTTSCGSRSPDRLPRWSSTGSGSYNVDGTRAKDENLMRNISTKVSWQARRASQLHFLYNFNNKGQFNRTENTGPITDFIDNAATIHQIINSHIVQSRVDVGAAEQRARSMCPAATCTATSKGALRIGVVAGSIPTFDSVLREHRVAPPNFLHRPATRVNVLSSVTLPQRRARPQGRAIS